MRLVFKAAFEAAPTQLNHTSKVDTCAAPQQCPSLLAIKNGAPVSHQTPKGFRRKSLCGVVKGVGDCRATSNKQRHIAAFPGIPVVKENGQETIPDRRAADFAQGRLGWKLQGLAPKSCEHKYGGAFSPAGRVTRIWNTHPHTKEPKKGPLGS